MGSHKIKSIKPKYAKNYGEKKSLSLMSLFSRLAFTIINMDMRDPPENH